MREVTPVFCVTPVTDSAWKVEAITETVSIKIPHIVNTKHIPADKEVVLRWQVVVQSKPGRKGAASMSSNGPNRNALAALARGTNRAKTK